MRDQLFRALAKLLRQGMEDHVKAFPDGDWRAVNDRLGNIRLIGQALLPKTMFMGNEDAAAAFEAAGQS